MDMVNNFFIMVTVIKDSIKMISLMVKEHIYGKMAPFIKEIFLIILNMDMENGPHLQILNPI